MTYLSQEITSVRLRPHPAPWRYTTRDGYTKTRGAPSATEVRLGSGPWRRVWYNCTSNGASYFIQLQRQPHFIPAYQLNPSTQTKETPR